MDYSGYTVRHNLILPEGGLHCLDPTTIKLLEDVVGGFLSSVLDGILGWAPGAVLGFPGAATSCWHTHQIDMHGDGNKGYSEHNWQCGTAGETLKIERNTILYTKGTAIKVRGNPLDKAVVDGNVFKSNRTGVYEWGAVSGYFLWGFTNYFWFHPTIDQTGNCDSDEITNPIQISTTNVFDSDPMGQLRKCNFGSREEPVDPPDQFMATGVTWWAKSAKTGQWYFLNTMPETAPDLHFADFDGDGICDVAKEINPRRQFYSNSGRTPWMLVGSVNPNPQPSDE